MYELIQVSDQTYYIQNPAKIGVVKTGCCGSNRIDLTVPR